MHIVNAPWEFMKCPFNRKLGNWTLAYPSIVSPQNCAGVDMKRLFGLIVLAVASPALAGHYKVVLTPPADGKILRGHGGLHAVDDRSATTLVRVISPGSEVKERGTIRVLVMNLGAKTFPFGPEQVTMVLGDGTKLAPVPISKFINGAELIEREMSRARITDSRIRSNLSQVAEQASSGPTAQAGVPVAGGPMDQLATEGFDQRSDAMMLPGAKTLDSIYQVLESQPVEPSKAWGGYYVFNVPKQVRASKSNQPLTIVVTTGGEVRRFNALLQYD